MKKTKSTLERAYHFYVYRLFTVKETALRVGTSVRTVSNWIKEFHWKSQRADNLNFVYVGGVKGYMMSFELHIAAFYPELSKPLKEPIKEFLKTFYPHEQ